VSPRGECRDYTGVGRERFNELGAHPFLQGERRLAVAIETTLLAARSRKSPLKKIQAIYSTQGATNTGKVIEIAKEIDAASNRSGNRKKQGK
jgi:hypothetical protein